MQRRKFLSGLLGGAAAVVAAPLALPTRADGLVAGDPVRPPDIQGPEVTKSAVVSGIAVYNSLHKMTKRPPAITQDVLKKGLTSERFEESLTGPHSSPGTYGGFDVLPEGTPKGENILALLRPYHQQMRWGMEQVIDHDAWRFTFTGPEVLVDEAIAVCENFQERWSYPQ